MSSFKCEICGAICEDSHRGYITGCEHHLPDIKPLRGFGSSLDFKSGNIRNWYIDRYGQKRWHSNDEMVNT